MDSAPLLPHTIQTCLGMSLHQGSPLQWQYPSDPAAEYQSRPKYHIPPGDLYEYFTHCVLNDQVPVRRQSLEVLRTNADRLMFNILACRNKEVTLAFLKQTVTSLIRIDLEQVAAMAISAIHNDETLPTERLITDLIKTIEPSLLRESCMWLDATRDWSRKPANEAKSENTMVYAHKIIFQKPVDQEKLQWSDFIPILLRVRRCRPASKTRCLFIPEWIFEAANAPIPEHHRIWDENGFVMPGKEPECPAPDDCIVLSRRDFRRLNRRILGLFRFWRPSIRLRAEIEELENNAIYSSRYFKRCVMPSDDTLLVVKHFLAFQRRLQLKIVSNPSGSKFLGKGEGQGFVQNTPNVETAFEKCLQVAHQQQGVLPIEDALLPSIDRCCILMESYVNIYSKDGDWRNLRFRRGIAGGSGRGPVDDYNMLCTILSRLQQSAQEKGIIELPGRAKKFLAKDIMHYLNSWQDDAFAGEEAPVWETWLSKRQAGGLLFEEWQYREMPIRSRER